MHFFWGIVPQLCCANAHRWHGVLAGEALEELFQRQGAQDVFFLDPRTAGGGDAEMDVIELCETIAGSNGCSGPRDLPSPFSLTFLKLWL